MPPSSNNGEPLVSINWLVETNSQSIPNNVDLVKQYVIYRESVWVSDYENEERNSGSPHKLEKVSRNGPKWLTDVNVDVVAKVYDSDTSETHYLILKNVFIVRTD